jgi:DNA repair photolyase
MHNCAYCYAPNVLRMERAHWGDVIEIKTNIPVILAKELKTKKPGVVGLSTVTDPYQPLEQKYSLTRYCLEQLLKYDFPVHIQTKSSLAGRDLDLIVKFSHIEVMMSIGTIHDDERKILEPAASSIEQRLRTLREFSNAGIRTSIFFGPIYPSTTLKEIPTILDTFLDQGVTEVLIDSLNSKPGIQENIHEKLVDHPVLDNVFSGYMTDKMKYYATIRSELIKEGKQRNMTIADAFE